MWSKWSWVFTIPTTGRDERRRRSAITSRAAGRGVGVDDEQPGLALDHGDVHVVPLVARHPHAVADLGEPRHARAYEPSILGTLDKMSAKRPETA